MLFEKKNLISILDVKNIFEALWSIVVGNPPVGGFEITKWIFRNPTTIEVSGFHTTNTFKC